MKWVEWVEPFGPSNEPVYMSCPASTAIAVQRFAASKTKPGFVYKNDEEALEDFIVVNWATISDIPEDFKYASRAHRS